MKKRKRASRLDPYRDQITKWCLQGIPVKKMADMLCEQTGDLYFEQMIYAYIYKHGLRFRPWIDVYAARNQCDECEHCHKYTNTNGKEGRICSLYWRTIQKQVVHSPVWCEKDGINERAEAYSVDERYTT